MSVTTDEQLTPYMFFKTYAGYSRMPDETPGQAQRNTAKRLVKAEQWAKKHKVKFDWMPDQDADISWMETETLKEYQRGDTEMLQVLASKRCESCGEFKVFGSLGGVHVLAGDQTYKRVVEAELALEEMYAVARR